MEKPLISVLIPTYNVERYVEEAIRSIMNQSYRNLEIIVVDDGSTDTTFQILTKLSEEDDRVIVSKNEKNQKIVETLNTAFIKSKGELIARMDGDDVSLPERIETQLRYLNDNPDISLVGLNIIVVDEDDNEIQKDHYITGFDKIREATSYASPVPHVWLAKREVYEKVGLYRIATAEDYDFILRCIDLGYKVDNIPDYLYMQRMRNGNTATASGLIQRKSISYVKYLQNERKTALDGKDSFSTENLIKYLSTSNLEKYLFNISSRYHFKYVTNKKKSKFLSLVYRMGSIIFAPGEQIKDIYNRRMYKKIKLESQSQS